MDQAVFQLPRDVLESDYKVTLNALRLATRHVAELEAENAALWAFVDAFKRWGREEGSEEAVYEALADLIPYERGDR